MWMLGEELARTECGLPQDGCREGPAIYERFRTQLRSGPKEATSFSQLSYSNQSL